MTLDIARIERLPHVEAALNYLVPMDEKPYRYAYEPPPPGVPSENGEQVARRVAIHDLRPVAAELSLDREGFALIRQRSAVRDFYDEDELRKVLYPEAQQAIAGATGAVEVIVFDHTIRQRIPGAVDRATGTPRQPVSRVHNDYTETSGPQRVRDLLPPKEAEAWLRGRFAAINLWRPIRAPLLDRPLALCDARSVAAGDFVATDLIYRDRRGEIYNLAYNPAHRWFYAPAMRHDEALLIKCYDSATDDGRARFVPHGSFDDPNMPSDAPPRESIEIRTLVRYPD
ncbi:MAG TPA: CmcJ/NvfI family oxidoreductase [Stellaceae bacterium]